MTCVPCCLCKAESSTPWADENGYCCVKCNRCGLVYVNPRPSDDAISAAVTLGMHGNEESVIISTGKGADPKRIQAFRSNLRSLVGSALDAKPFSWLDVGAGYGEFIMAVQAEGHSQAVVEGIEPCETKARWAEVHHGKIKAGRKLDDCAGPYDFISLMNVLSHLPEPIIMVRSLVARLQPGGYLILKTGNGAELEREEYPGPLFLPDHLSFFGEPQLEKLLRHTGLRRINLQRHAVGSGRLPIIPFLRNKAMNVVRRLRGKPIHKVNWDSYSLIGSRADKFASIWLLAQKPEEM